MTRLLNWTGFVFLWPSRYVERSTYWQRFDLQHWTENEYEYDEDDWNGLRDFAQNPRETVELGHGDCEDYALVAASWALARGRSVSFIWCFNEGSKWPDHLVCYDGHCVYSSGDIYENTTPSEYVTLSTYDWSVERKL